MEGDKICHNCGKKKIEHFYVWGISNEWVCPVSFFEEMTKESKICLDEVANFFNDDKKSKLWWETPNPLLGDVSPVQMIQMGRQQKLLDFINNSLAGNRP